MVEADVEKIKQVLINLMVNAIKYGNEDGEVLVRTFDMDENILIEVADNGNGIPQKHLSKIFERFYRVDKSRDREQGGSGLGLSIVKHIIEAHNQSINVRSTIGTGTTFSFTLRKLHQLIYFDFEFHNFVFMKINIKKLPIILCSFYCDFCNTGQEKNIKQMIK